MVVTNENKNEYIEWEHSHISNSLVVSFNQKKKRDIFFKMCPFVLCVSLLTQPGDPVEVCESGPKADERLFGGSNCGHLGAV